MSVTGELLQIAIVLDIADGSDPWLAACLDSIDRYTVRPRVYVASASRDDSEVSNVSSARWCTMLDHPDASTRGNRLQRCFDMAREDGADVVAVLCSGVLPVHEDWLGRLTAEIGQGAPVAGTFEARNGIEDDIRCLCISMAFLEAHRLRFDDHPAPLSAMVDRAYEVGASVRELPRSNRNELRGFPGAIFGDAVFVPGMHGRQMALRDREIADQLAVGHFVEFVEWMRGSSQAREVYFVLGMHRSGTSLLTSCLEQCGLSLGNAVRDPLRDQPRGSFERRDARMVNEAILSDAGGSWKCPPCDDVSASGEQMAVIGAVLDELESNSPGGLKDPRLLLTIELWLQRAANPVLVGTFRHPSAVAASLWDRDRIPADQAILLWRQYNERLVRLHEKYQFPLVEFDLSDTDKYGRRVARIAADLGLQPRFDAIMEILDVSAGDRVVAQAVPDSCADIYAYLIDHRSADPSSDGGLSALLVEWEQNRGTPQSIARRMGTQRRMWGLGRRLPRTVQVQVWRALVLVRKSFRRRDQPAR